MKDPIYSLATYPFVRLMLCSISGILLGYQSSTSLSGWIVMGVVLLILLLGPVLIGIILKSQLYSLQFIYAHVSYHLFVILATYLIYCVSSYEVDNELKSYLRSYQWEKVEIRGLVSSSKNSNEDLKLILENNHITIDGNQLVCSCKIYASGIEGVIDEGDVLKVKATVLPSDPARNPHSFDSAKWMDQNEIMIRVNVDEFKIIEKKQRFSWHQIRRIIKDQLQLLYNSENIGLASALIAGDKGEIDSLTRTAFSRVGLSHIMAVSGLHVGFLMAPFWILIPHVWSYRYRKHLLAILVLLVLFIYVGITGFSPSVIRASITGYILFVARLFYKFSRPINLTSCAAFFMLILYPENLFDIGFQLSFSAVFIILMIMPTIQLSISPGHRHSWYSALMMTAIVSIIIQIGLFPIQAHYFGEISLVSPLSNVLFVPLLGIVLPFSVFNLILSFLLPNFSSILNIVSDTYFTGMIKYAHHANTWSGTWTSVQVNNIMIWLIWLTLLFFIAHVRFHKIRWKVLAVLLLCIVGFQVIEIARINEYSLLKITYFDVGQGDSALIQTPNGNAILMDAGVWSPSYNSSQLILEYCEKEGIRKLDAVILSHPHADHIGGIQDLIGSIEIDIIYNSGFNYDSKLYGSYINKALQSDVPVFNLSSGDIVDVDSSILMFVYSPHPELTSSDANEHSIVAELIYGDTQFLFTGDAEHQAEQKLIENYPNLIETDVLKVGHHGSRSSTDERLLLKIKPDIAVVSSGVANKFNHPHPETVWALNKHEVQTWYTAKSGSIEITSDGQKFTVKSELQ